MMRRTELKVMKKRSLPSETSTADALANVRVDRAALTHLKHGKPEEDNCEDVPSMQISYIIVNIHIALQPKKQKQENSINGLKLRQSFYAGSKVKHTRTR